VRGEADAAVFSGRDLAENDGDWLVLCCLSAERSRDYPDVPCAAEAGWTVAEVGRQPWAIQDLMPVTVAATELAGANVMISFWLFAALFTLLLAAEVKIMLKQIKLGF
jgi:hypothetical protein